MQPTLAQQQDTTSELDFVAISRLMLDEYAQRILVSTINAPATALDVARVHGIPLAAVYRRIHALEKAGLLTCLRRALTRQGKRISVYQANVKEAQISYVNGRVRFRATLIRDTANGRVAQNFDVDITPTKAVDRSYIVV